MNEPKRQKIPTGLWVVATPIGNLADLTDRARQALSEADAVLCEDTRRTGQLLAALGLQKSMERLDAHASPAKIAKVVERLTKGENLALVTDAGTPAISDPGSALVAAAREAGIAVVPVPGASAVMTLLSVSGFEETAFTFRGFFPRKEKEIREELELARGSRVSRVFVWFESPQRIAETLRAFAAEDAVLVAGKELTKLHERVFSGNPAEILADVESEIAAEGERGEWCVAACWKQPSKDLHNFGESSEWVKALQCLLDARVPASDAARQVSQHFGVAKNQAYESALRLLGKKS